MSVPTKNLPGDYSWDMAVLHRSKFRELLFQVAVTVHKQVAPYKEFFFESYLWAPSFLLSELTAKEFNTLWAIIQYDFYTEDHEPEKRLNTLWFHCGVTDVEHILIPAEQSRIFNSLCLKGYLSKLRRGTQRYVAVDYQLPCGHSGLYLSPGDLTNL